MNGRTGALKPGKLGLSCKANNCCGVGISDLGIILTLEASLMNLIPLLMSARPAPVEWYTY